MGIASPDCAAFIPGLRGAGVDATVYTSNSCDDEAVRGLPESAGTVFETPGYIVEQPELYNDFVQFELAEREAALDAYGPQSPAVRSCGRCSRPSCSSTRWPTR